MKSRKEKASWLAQVAGFLAPWPLRNVARRNVSISRGKGKVSRRILIAIVILSIVFWILLPLTWFYVYLAVVFITWYVFWVRRH